MTLQLLQSQFPFTCIWGKFDFLFHQCAKRMNPPYPLLHRKRGHLHCLALRIVRWAQSKFIFHQVRKHFSDLTEHTVRKKLGQFSRFFNEIKTEWGTKSFLMGFRVCWPLLWLLFVSHFVFLRDIWIRTQRAAVASRRATNLATQNSRKLKTKGKFPLLWGNVRMFSNEEFTRMHTIIQNFPYSFNSVGEYTFWPWFSRRALSDLVSVACAQTFLVQNSTLRLGLLRFIIK